MVSHRQRRNSNTLIIGLLVFILAMIITFSDVYGLDRFDLSSPGDKPTGDFNPNPGPTLTDWQEDAFISQGDYINPTLPVSSVPPSVPEPTTLTLLALGCGALLIRKRKTTS